MTEPDPGLSHDPAPQRGRAGGLALAFAMLGGPAAWFIQLNVNYGLLSQPCFPGPERNAELPAYAFWTVPTALVVYALCLLAALGATLVAVRLYRRTRGEQAHHEGDVEEVGNGRTRFLAYWGILLGVGSSFVIFVNLLALSMVPPCVQ